MKDKEDLRHPIDKFIKMLSRPKGSTGTLMDAKIDNAEKEALGMKKAKRKSYKKGGKVRGCGIAQRGLTKGKMR